MILEVALAALLACDPSLTAAFTPLRPTLGRYQVCTTADPLDVVKRAASVVELIDPLDAFGTAGPYDRGRLARLYSGRRARIVRESRMEGGIFRSRTLISPYPDATLTALHEGTMIIEWTLEVDGGRPTPP